MGECIPKCKAAKFLVFGLVLILVRLYTTWDMWVVVGILAICKAIMLFMMPACPACNPQTAKKKK
jgi:hypothetical protein